LICNPAIEALPDLPRRHATDDGVGRDIAGDHGAAARTAPSPTVTPGITITA
jgi:hypothetical protein